MHRLKEAAQNFRIGIEKIPNEVIRAFAILKKAAAMANNRLGKMDDKRAGLIAQACDEILRGRWLRATSPRGWAADRKRHPVHYET